MILFRTSGILCRMTETRQTDLSARLVQAGVRPTRQRLRVLEELAREPDDATAQTLFQRLREQGEGIGLATVYRTLGSLADHGVVDTLSHSPGEVCYRLCSEQHHHHLVCSSCHRVVELSGCGLESWLASVTQAADFTPTSHHIEVVGLCGDCR
jgi:Fur family transcriptional regulator, ferric uptake regulator